MRAFRLRLVFRQPSSPFFLVCSRVLFCFVLFQTYDVCGPSHGLGFGLSLYGSIPCFAVPAVLSTPDSKNYSDVLAFHLGLVGL